MKKITITLLLMAISIYLLAQTPVAPATGDGTAANPYQITSLENLYWIAVDNTRWENNYVQTAGINASATSTWFPNGTGGYTGWTTIGDLVTKFKGTYNGQGHSISNLTCNQPSMDYIGLFGRTGSGAVISNLGVTNVNISGGVDVGGLVGWVNQTTITNCYSTGTVHGFSLNCGGLIGIADYGIISNCYSTCTVIGAGGVGGFVGYNQSASTINNCYCTGAVTGASNAGGFVGTNYYGIISNCYSRSNVTRSSGTDVVFGGFVAYNFRATMNKCYSTGWVKDSGIIIPDKGFCGVYDADDMHLMSDTYWDTDTSGAVNSAGVTTGKTTVEMLNMFTYAGWDFNTIWNMLTGLNDHYPTLRWQTTVANDDLTANQPAYSATLYHAYPNPFNPATTISFEIRNNANVSIEIYNLKGQKVTTLVNENLASGRHSVVWNGKDDQHNNCGSSMYFYKMQTEHYTKTNSMILIK